MSSVYAKVNIDRKIVKEKKHEPTHLSCRLRDSTKPGLVAAWNFDLCDRSRTTCSDIFLKPDSGAKSRISFQCPGTTATLSSCVLLFAPLRQ